MQRSPLGRRSIEQVLLVPVEGFQSLSAIRQLGSQLLLDGHRVYGGGRYCRDRNRMGSTLEARLKNRRDGPIPSTPTAPTKSATLLNGQRPNRNAVDFQFQ